jgi:hypothetical protein
MVRAKKVNPQAAGVAALSICESLLLALGDLKVLTQDEVVGVVADAANAHRFATGSPEESAFHLSVAALLDEILASGNSIRRT